MIILTGEEITTLQAFTIRSYYPTLAINYLIALILAWLVRKTTIWLDGHYSWEHSLWLRLLLQISIGVVLISMAAFLLVFIYFRSFGQSIMASSYPRYQFPLSVAMLALLNAFYVIYYFYHRVRLLSDTIMPQSAFSQSLSVADGRETLLLPVEEIAYIYLAGKEVLVKSGERKDYLCSGSLDEIEAQLDPQMFFRINRRLIAHRSACRGYQALEYGKLEVKLVPVPTENATVSQRKATAFKEWIK